MSAPGGSTGESGSTYHAGLDQLGYLLRRFSEDLSQELLGMFAEEGRAVSDRAALAIKSIRRRQHVNGSCDGVGLLADHSPACRSRRGQSLMKSEDLAAWNAIRRERGKKIRAMLFRNLHFD